MTFDNFRVRVSKALLRTYGKRLAKNTTFHDDDQRTPPRWEARFVLDGKPRYFAFDCGQPPGQDEEGRLSRRLIWWLML
jgi:hypothetical protein